MSWPHLTVVPRPCRLTAPDHTDQTPQGGFEWNTILYIYTVFHDSRRLTASVALKPVVPRTNRSRSMPKGFVRETQTVEWATALPSSILIRCPSDAGAAPNSMNVMFRSLKIRLSISGVPGSTATVPGLSGVEMFFCGTVLSKMIKAGCRSGYCGPNTPDHISA